MSTTLSATLNSTQYYDTVCHSKPEHYLLLAYVLFSAIFGLIGNSLVFTATLYRKAFTGDDFSIVFVRNLAIADILYILLQVIPDITARISSHKWVLGDVTCYISAHFVYMTGIANMSFILTISLYRLLTCTFPLRFRIVTSKKRVNLIAAAVWVYSVIPSLIYLSFQGKVRYDTANTDCTLSFDKKDLVDMVIGPIFIIIPFIGIIVFNITLLVLALRSAQKMGTRGNKAFLTISAVSGLFVISWLPFIIRKILTVLVDSNIIWLKKTDIMFFQLSTFGNPVIYTLVNARFRNFLKVSICQLIAPKRRISSYHSTYTQSTAWTNNTNQFLTKILGRISNTSAPTQPGVLRSHSMISPRLPEVRENVIYAISDVVEDGASEVFSKL